MTDLDQGFADAIKITEGIVREITEERFPSDQPDRPGWWRCKGPDSTWVVRMFIDDLDGSLKMLNQWPMLFASIPVAIMIRDGWQFAGRFEMPGEE